MNLNDILEESRKYDEMFRGVPERIGAQKTDIVIKRHIRWIRAINNRNDFAVWWLRLLRLAIFEEKHVHDFTFEIEDEIERYNRKTRGNKITRRGEVLDLIQLERYQTHFEHFFSLPIQEIQRYRFHWQKPNEVLEDFRAYEEEWKEGREGIVQGDEKVFLDVGNNFVWFDLERASCDIEGDAMGHCGNSPAADDPNQTILSLRERTRDGWRVALTFIYHKREKALGEMKGRGNEKPAQKYHKYIIPLLMDDRIEEIISGGYMPEENFSVLDLDKGMQERIRREKPSLFTIPEYINAFGLDEYSERRLRNRYDLDLWEDGSVIVKRYPEIDDLINESTNFNADDFLSVLYRDDFPDNRVANEDLAIAIENSPHEDEFMSAIRGIYKYRKASSVYDAVTLIDDAMDIAHTDLRDIYKEAVLDSTQENMETSLEDDMNDADARIYIETDQGSTSTSDGVRVSTESIEGPMVLMGIDEFIGYTFEDVEEGTLDYISMSVSDVQIPAFEDYRELDQDEFNDLLEPYIEELNDRANDI